MHRPNRPDPRAPSIAELVDRIVSASTDSNCPRWFEEVVRDAFEFLGFDAQLLGGSGKTDVLLRAPIGRKASYTAAVDAKTAGSGSLGDHQVDWITLQEHRDMHQTDFSVLIGPNPRGTRLFERAAAQRVSVLSAKQLADLCNSHSARPLGLVDYKSVLASAGQADLSHVTQRSADAERLLVLTRWLVSAIREEADRFDSASARDLYRRLARDEPAIESSEAEIHGLLEWLASPLIGAIQGNPDKSYVPACSPEVVAERLRVLKARLVGQQANAATKRPIE